MLRPTLENLAVTSRMLTFDGAQYPDGAASDPGVLQLMQGSPPPPDKRIRFEDDRYFEFPNIRWSLSHMRELVPTATVACNLGSASELGTVDPGIERAIDAMRFSDLHGRSFTWAESLGDTYCDGILVLHRGVRVYERYAGALRPERPHCCFSITKSYAATLAATLVHERVLDQERLVPFYLPELGGTAYADVRLRELLDMQVGVAHSELYSDPAAGVWDYARAGGLRARPAGYAGPRTFYEYLLTLRKEGVHGEAFAYKTVNTEVLCWIMKRVTGVALSELLAGRIWARIGCERDGYLSVDSIGVEMGGGGLNACLRDLARFGELMLREGAWGAAQVIPGTVVAAIRRGSDPAKFAKAGYELLRGYSYRDMWWVTHNALGAFEARGIHGQRLYVAPAAELVIARFASHPIASSAANDPITMPAFAALAQLLMRS
jgi:CubicO group peptidase (beta-lactamase class C family)